MSRRTKLRRKIRQQQVKERSAELDAGAKIRSSMDKIIEFAKLREEYCRNHPPCTACGSLQIELRSMDIRRGFADWKCRNCGHKWTDA